MQIGIILLASFLMFAALPLFGQSTGCTLTSNNAPKLFGFKLGMTQDAAEKMLGVTAEPNVYYGGFGRRSKTGPHKYDIGEKYIFIENDNHDAKGLDATVDKLSLTFFEGQLFQIEVTGNDKTDWSKIASVPAYFQKKYSIPANVWQMDGEQYKGDEKQIAACSGVTLRYDQFKGVSTKFSILNTDTKKRTEKALADIKAAAEGASVPAAATPTPPK